MMHGMVKDSAVVGTVKHVSHHKHTAAVKAKKGKSVIEDTIVAIGAVIAFIVNL